VQDAAGQHNGGDGRWVLAHDTKQTSEALCQDTKSMTVYYNENMTLLSVDLLSSKQVHTEQCHVLIIIHVGSHILIDSNQLLNDS
jgi:hypothetical protein